MAPLVPDYKLECFDFFMDYLLLIRTF